MNEYLSNAPSDVRKLYKFSKISLIFFLLFQIGGLFIIYKEVVGFTSSFDTSSLENGSLLSDLNTKGLNILPVTKFTNWESFLSGTAISMTSGFWFAIAFAGVKLQRPYKYKAYRILQWSFYLQVFFFALSFNSIFSEHKSIFNPGTLGSALTILFTVPIYQISRKRTVRLWSQEYVPPLPEITEP